MSRVLMLVLLTLAAAGCTRIEAAGRAPDPRVPVRVAPLAVERVALPVTAAGTLGPKEEVTLGFKVGGVVARVMVDEGQTVRAGQTLATLDLGEIEPAVTRARSAADKAERDLARMRRLYADSVASLAQLQDAETGRDVARADLETATFNREHAIIVAPANGVILRRSVESGELVQPGMPALVLGSEARGQVVRTGLADRQVVRVRRGDLATVRFDALPGREFEGRVAEIGAAADPQTGTYRVEVALAGAAGLGSGLIGMVAVTMVPNAAVLEADGARGTVYTLAADGRHAERRAVTIAFLDGERTAIAGGLEGARAVITEGAAYLESGSVVEVMP